MRGALGTPFRARSGKNLHFPLSQLMHYFPPLCQAPKGGEIIEVWEWGGLGLRWGYAALCFFVSAKLF